MREQPQDAFIDVNGNSCTAKEVLRVWIGQLTENEFMRADERRKMALIDSLMGGVQMKYPYAYAGTFPKKEDVVRFWDGCDDALSHEEANNLAFAWADLNCHLY